MIVRRRMCFWCLIALGAIASAVAVSCERGSGGNGFLRLSMSDDYDYPEMSRLSEYLKSNGGSGVIPDTNDFILTVSDQSGKTVYKGLYSEKPGVFELPAGVYDVSVLSSEFSAPAYDAPRFGDSRTVIVNPGETIGVAFLCTQLNSGIRFIFDNSFLSEYSSGYIMLSQKEFGALEYPYAEHRIAYFNPGEIIVIYVENFQESALFSRYLDPAEILTVNLSASQDTPEGFSITVDTARNWTWEDYVTGGDRDGSKPEQALTVADLPSYAGAEDVWVEGYIVGGDVTTSKVNTKPPFAKESHLAIADYAFVSEREQCAAVELPSSGGIREALNLVSNPDNLHRKLFVRGDIVNYFGYPGVKQVKEYILY